MGRILKLNRAVLEPNKNDRAQILPFGDWHVGYPTTNMEKIEGYIKFCLDKGVYVLGMGDFIEAGLTSSIGDSVYSQTLNPQQQMDAVIDLMQPLAKRGLILGMHFGNHEKRIVKTSGIDIHKNICRILGVRDFRFAMFHLFKVGKQSYVFYSTHGASGARLAYTKVKAVIDIARFINAEVICYGHIHETYSQKFAFYEIDRSTQRKIQRDKYAILTGHFLEYEGSYAEEKCMSPSKTGAVKISLYGNEHDIHTSQ